jgi:xanthine/uracil permease
MCKPESWLLLLVSACKTKQDKVLISSSFFLIVMGIFSKFAAALVAIPAPVLGGMTSES